MFGKNKINDSAIIKFGFLGGILEALYCGLVVFLMWAVESSQPNETMPMAAMLLVLLLFVLSAGISALLIFGYPAYLFLNKRYGEALMTAVFSLATLAIVGIAAFVLITVVY